MERCRVGGLSSMVGRGVGQPARSALERGGTPWTLPALAAVKSRVTVAVRTSELELLPRRITDLEEKLKTQRSLRPHRSAASQAGAFSYRYGNDNGFLACRWCGTWHVHEARRYLDGASSSGLSSGRTGVTGRLSLR